MKRLFSISLFLSLLYFCVSVKASESLTNSCASETSSNHNALINSEILSMTTKPAQPKLTRTSSERPTLADAKGAATRAAWNARPKKAPTSKHNSLSLSSSTSDSFPADSAPSIIDSSFGTLSSVDTSTTANAADLLKLAFAYNTAGDGNKALDYLKKAAYHQQFCEEQAEALARLFMIGAINDELSKVEQALDCFKNVLNRLTQKSVARIWLRFARLYHTRNNYQKTIEYLWKIAHLTEDFEITRTHAIFLIGLVYHDQGNYEEAIKVFKKNAEQSDDLHEQAWAFYLLGHIYSQKEKRMEKRIALFYLRRAAKYRELQAAAMLESAYLYYDLEDQEKAINYFNQVAEQNFDHDAKKEAQQCLQILAADAM